MNGQVEDVKQYEVRPLGSPVRVKADPDLVSDVTISLATSTDPEPSETKLRETVFMWESVVSDLPSDDEDGEVFDRQVASLLIGMNMVQYLHLFKDADIGFNLFLTLTEDDLDVIGISDPSHRKALAHGISNIRKTKVSHAVTRGLKDDVADTTVSVDEAIHIMCHTLRHVNELVSLLRNYRSRLQMNRVRNQMMDSRNSAAYGAKILAKEAIAQAELLKIQLKGMLHKLDPLNADKGLTYKSKSTSSKKSRTCEKGVLGGVVMTASISLFLLAIILRRRVV